MNTNIKIGVALVAGAALGAFGGYSVAKRQYETKLEEELDKEFAKLKKEYSERVEKATEESFKNDKLKKIIGDYVNKEVIDTEQPKVQEANKEDKTNYTSYFKGGNPDTTTWNDTTSSLAENEHPEDDDPEYEYEKIFEKQSKKAPKLIKYEDYGEDPNYTQDILYYYAGDDTLTNNEEEIIDDTRLFVGDCLLKYDFRNSPETSIFVRNYRLGRDFEIIKNEGSYATVSGDAE